MSETVEQQQTQSDYTPIVLNTDVLATLDVDSVYVQDLRKINSTWEIRYFKNLVPDLLLKCCAECGKFFLLDEYEFEYVQHERCPFCNVQDKRAGQVKDIFDV
jgi:intraflagellar transport protein 122